VRAPGAPASALTGHWSGRGAAAVTGCGRISLALLAPAHHHIDLPAAAAGADPPLAPIEHGRFAAIPSSHLGGVGRDLMAAILAPNDQPDLGGGSVPERHPWAGL
jgi:hypothetical protein